MDPEMTMSKGKFFTDNEEWVDCYNSYERENCEKDISEIEERLERLTSELSTKRARLRMLDR